MYLVPRIDPSFFRSTFTNKRVSPILLTTEYETWGRRRVVDTVTVGVAYTVFPPILKDL